MKKLIKVSLVVGALYGSILAVAIVLPIPLSIKAGLAAFALVACSFSLTTNN